MKKTLYLGLVSLLPMITSCDTTEEGFHLGDLSDVTLATVPVGQLQMGADGTERKIEINSNVRWQVVNDGSRFTVSPQEGTGNAELTVTGPVNVNDNQTPSENIRVVAMDFDKEVNVEIIQARLMFNMGWPDIPEMPEEGGEFQLTFNSSINWQFDPQGGTSLGWFDFSPGYEGEGSWNEVSVTARMLPNYTQYPRSASLQLQPQNSELLQYISLPSSFGISQQAGTYPEITGAQVKENGEQECTMEISYDSKSPVQEIGVRVYDDGIHVSDFTNVGNESVAGGLSQSGSGIVTVSGLLNGKMYKACPYVKNMVGETEDKDIEIAFVLRSSNDPAILDCVIEPSYKSVKATVTATGGNYELVHVGFSIIVPGDPETNLITLVQGVRAKDATAIIKTEDILVHSSEYYLQPLLTYIDSNGSLVDVMGDKISFTTLDGRGLDEGDNMPPV